MGLGRTKRTLILAGAWLFVFALVLYLGLRQQASAPSEIAPPLTPKEPYSKVQVSVLPRRADASLSPSKIAQSSQSPTKTQAQTPSTAIAETFLGTVTGRLVGPGRAKIPYQKLCIAWKDERGLHERSVRTNSDGEFRLEKLKSGLYWWSSALRGGETGCEGQHPYDNSQSFLIEDSHVELGEIIWALPAYAAIIRGEVFELGGQPAVNCEVLLRDVQNTLVTRTDDQGRFAFTRLFPDQYDLLARSESGLAPPQKITPLPGSTKTLSLVLSKPSGAIEGRVYGADRAPFARVTVILRQPGKGDDPAGPYDELIAKSGDDGAFRFDR
ncbi:MAG: carboxypeptidase-like regulatory domain-containing protein, partial [Planctomycetota bacterium]|nr:carboxypeptidase-like regulatory domain-containing protein [Planctomycetota bacterium]